MGGLNTTENNNNWKNKLYVLVIKKYTSNIGILPFPSKSGSINVSDQHLHILSHKSLLNLPRVFNKIKSESESKYDSCFYKIQRNNNVRRIGMKIILSNKTFDHLMSSMEKHIPIESKVS